MPRNMSFSMTTEAFLNQTKDVTRRLGWWFLKPGDVLCGVEKGMGLKKGEKVKRLGLIRVVSVKKEALCEIEDYPSDETLREGFPYLSPQEFQVMFCKHNHINRFDWVNRIEFEYVEEEGGEGE